MNVKVRSIGHIGSLLGREEIDVTLPGGSVVGELLARLSELGGEQLAADRTVPMEQSAHAPLRVMINGRDIAVLEGQQTILHDGDDVLVFGPIAGG